MLSLDNTDCIAIMAPNDVIDKAREQACRKSANLRFLRSHRVAKARRIEPKPKPAPTLGLNAFQHEKEAAKLERQAIKLQAQLRVTRDKLDRLKRVGPDKPKQIARWRKLLEPYADGPWRHVPFKLRFEIMSHYQGMPFREVAYCASLDTGMTITHGSVAGFFDRNFNGTCLQSPPHSKFGSAKRAKGQA